MISSETIQLSAAALEALCIETFDEFKRTENFRRTSGNAGYVWRWHYHFEQLLAVYVFPGSVWSTAKARWWGLPYNRVGLPIAFSMEKTAKTPQLMAKGTCCTQLLHVHGVGQKWHFIPVLYWSPEL